MEIDSSVTKESTKKSEGDDSQATNSMEPNKGGDVEEVAEGNNSLELQPSTGNNRSLIEQKQEEDHELESTKAEMGEVREENERLKALLAQTAKDYQDLKMHFLNVIRKQKPNKKSTGIISASTAHEVQESNISEEADDLTVSLCLGRTASTKINIKDCDVVDEGMGEAGLALELGCRSYEPAAVVKLNSSFENTGSAGDPKELDEVTEIWPSSKMLKTRDDDVSQQQTSHLKNARVSVRARCDGPTMNDGCQWRKYGQKIAKGNPCPRAYYRCTVSPSCPVRKQVQRCAQDMSILITTYEGNHNHSLPMSATAMASATSAAASMLQSQSSTSQKSHGDSTNAPISSSSNTSNLHSHGLNFTNSTSLSQNSSRLLLPNSQFYFHNSSISTNNSHPTITLDLTAPPPSPFGLRFPSAVLPRYSSSTCLNFSSSSPSSLDCNTLLQAPSWINNHAHPANYFNLGSHQKRMSQVIGGSSLNPGNQLLQEPNFYHSYIQNSQKAAPPPPTPPLPPQHHFLTDSLATATKAITSNPKFQSALAAALTSFVGTTVGTSGVIRENHFDGSMTSTENSDVKLEWAAGESLAPKNSIYPSTQVGVEGASLGYLNKSSSPLN